MPCKIGTVQSSLRYRTIIIGRSAVSLMNVLQCQQSVVHPTHDFNSHTYFSLFFSSFFCYCLSMERVNNAQFLTI